MSTTLETDPDSVSRNSGQLRIIPRVSTSRATPFSRRPRYYSRGIALLMIAAGSAGLAGASAAGSSWEVPWTAEVPAGNSADAPTVGYSVRLGPDESWFNSTLGPSSSGWIAAGPSNPSFGTEGIINSPQFPTTGGSWAVVGTTPEGRVGYEVNLDPGGLGAVQNPPNPELPPRTDHPVEPVVPVPPPPLSSGSASAIVSNSQLLAVVVVAGGAGYSRVPEVVVQGGGGTGARAVARLTGGAITAIEVTEPGRGYTEAPQVFIAPPEILPKVGVKVGGPDWIRVEMQLVSGRKYQLWTSSNLRKWTAVDEPFTATSEVVTGEFLTDRRGQYFRLEEIQ